MIIWYGKHPMAATVSGGRTQQMPHCRIKVCPLLSCCLENHASCPLRGPEDNWRKGKEISHFIHGFIAYIHNCSYTSGDLWISCAWCQEPVHRGLLLFQYECCRRVSWEFYSNVNVKLFKSRCYSITCCDLQYATEKIRQILSCTNKKISFLDADDDIVFDRAIRISI